MALRSSLKPFLHSVCTGLQNLYSYMYYPSATYRVQLNSSYTLSHLQTIIGYLNKLGISTIYASPITTSMKGSTHGYDVCNPDALNEEIGTMQQLENIAKELHEKGMGWLQDIVPNHMAFIMDNKRLYDVLERGNHSPYYTYFDINWKHFDATYRGKLMVPFLGKDLQEAITDNDIKLVDEDGIFINCSGTKYPLSTQSFPFVFSDKKNERISSATEALLEKINSTKEEWDKAMSEWKSLLKTGKEAVQKALENVNTNQDLLHEVVSQQNYILTSHKVTEAEINFRRFFTVNQLICLHMEDEFVFNDYHRFALELSKKGLLQGLRIDHIDGLYDPKEYVERLRKMFGDQTYVIAEKILEYNENIPQDWKLQGTSGYEFLSFINQLLTYKKGAEKLLDFYQELVPQSSSYDDLVYEKKIHFLLSQMGGELENLIHDIKDLELFPPNDSDEQKLRQAVSILMACFPVYRIYPDVYPLNEEAKKITQKAFANAAQKIGDAKHELALLQTIFDADGSKTDDNKKLLFLRRLMQFTGPLAAKGVEDTTFYVYNSLISHNEVGDSPSQLGITIQEFHDKMLSRQRNNPFSLNATSTHDTKRGEDGRMRINALASLPDEWIQNVNNWRQMNTPFISLINNKPAPSTNDEYFIYQSLIGAFPEDFQMTESFTERTFTFLEKALREAKVETSYSEPNDLYEAACKHFIISLLDKQHTFLQSFLPFLEKIIDIGTQYSLAQTVIKITAPGIPDVYQGCELWDLSYVDPDNRRPVDYDRRINHLNEIITKEKEGANEVLSFIHQYKKEGTEKLYATYKTLNLRRTYNDVFLYGDYLPLATNHEKLMAFARKKDEQWIVVVVPFSEDFVHDNEALTVTLPQGAPARWINVFTNETIKANSLLNVQKMLQQFPVAVLTFLL